MAQTRDLSEVGVFIQTGARVEAGTPVQIFVMPPGAAQAVRLIGVVARISGDGIGVQFAPMAPQVREAFDRFVASLAAPSLAEGAAGVPEEFDPEAIERALRKESQERGKKRALALQVHETARRALDAGDADLAITLLSRAIDLAPGMAAFHHDLGAAYYQRGDIDKAVYHLDRALKLQPEED